MALQVDHAESQCDQFLMKFWLEFEPVLAGLLFRICNLVYILDKCLEELLHEEQWISTQMGMSSEIVSFKVVHVAYAIQGKG